MMELLKLLLALITAPVSAYDFVKRRISAGATVLLHPRLAMLPAAEQRAIAAWLATAQADDPLVVFTNWNMALLAQLNITQQAVIQLLLTNGARATTCPNCVSFSSVPQMNRCKLFIRAQANDLCGFSNPIEQQAYMLKMQAAAAPPARVADTLTVYSVTHRTADVDCDMQFFG